MVTFICYHCDKTLKKQQIDKHPFQCRRPLNLICIDCKKNFHGEEHVAHTSCLSEKQLYWGKYANKKPSEVAKEEQKKQEQPKQEQIQLQEDNISFVGWRKAINNALKTSSKKQIKLDKIRKIVVDQYLQFYPDCKREDAEQEFQDKVQGGKNFSVVQVAYIKKNKLE